MTVQIFICNTLTVTKNTQVPQLFSFWYADVCLTLNLVFCDDIFSCWCPHTVELQAEQSQIYLFEKRQGRLQYRASVHALFKGAPLQVGCNTSEFSRGNKNSWPNFQLANYVHNEILCGMSVCCNILPPFLPQLLHRNGTCSEL